MNNFKIALLLIIITIIFSLFSSIYIYKEYFNDKDPAIKLQKLHNNNKLIK